MKRRLVTVALWLSLALVLGAGPVPRPGEVRNVQEEDGLALVILSSTDMRDFHGAIALVESNGGQVPQAFPPNAFVAALNDDVEWALRRHPAVLLVSSEVIEGRLLRSLGAQAGTAATIWNTAFRGVRDPLTLAGPPGPPPELHRSDVRIAPAVRGAVPAAGDGPSASAPTSGQTSEFLAGKVVYSVLFVESSGGTGNCVPAAAQTEDWSAAQQSTVLSEISAGLAFWTARASRPNPLTFLLDNQGVLPTSCEPIRGSTSNEGKWTADVLTAAGFPATPSNYQARARSFANSRRAALSADWAYLILVVNSLNDADGLFTDGYFAYAYLNGPFVVMTYDNDGWGISRMNFVAAHETGHIFGALDEYAASGCSTADTWGYLNVANASCNNRGIRNDFSIMGEASEQQNASVDVSTSARGAIGWRNPVGAVVDVVRTTTLSLTPYTPDPTSDATPTYPATAGNSPFPPGGCNTLGGFCYRTPSPVSISKVKAAQWRVDANAFTKSGVVPADGAFDEETGEVYSFTPSAPVSAGLHTFQTRSVNTFGHLRLRQDKVTIE